MKSYYHHRYRHTSSPLGSTGSSLGSAGEQSRDMETSPLGVQYNSTGVQVYRDMETSPLGPLAPHMRRHDLSDTETDAVTGNIREI